jgi:hypothetical protein
MKIHDFIRKRSSLNKPFELYTEEHIQEIHTRHKEDKPFYGCQAPVKYISSFVFDLPYGAFFKQVLTVFSDTYGVSALHTTRLDIKDGETDIIWTPLYCTKFPLRYFKQAFIPDALFFIAPDTDKDLKHPDFTGLTFTTLQRQ